MGFNIIEGIKDVLKENPQIKLNIVETADPAAFNGPIFAHSSVGKNTDPKSKCDAFAEVLEKIGDKVDIAFLNSATLISMVCLMSQEYSHITRLP